MRVARLGLAEEFRQRFLGAVALFRRIGLLLGLDHVSRGLEDLLEELEAREEALLVPLPDLLQPLAGAVNFGLPRCRRRRATSLISTSRAFRAGSLSRSTSSST